MRFALKVAILASGRTQRDIAASIGISENRLSDVVRGWTAPHARERRALAHLLERPEDELFAEDHPGARTDGPDVRQSNDGSALEPQKEFQ